MNIIIDTNILFAALIKNSKTRELILKSDCEFVCPEYLITEFQKHKLELYSKSNESYNSFDKLYTLLFEKIRIIPHDLIKQYIPRAENTVNNIDPDDMLFIACALAYPESILWSNDSALKRQKVVRVVNTEELLNLLE